jgi:hypothetical protein
VLSSFAKTLHLPKPNAEDVETYRAFLATTAFIADEEARFLDIDEDLVDLTPASSHVAEDSSSLMRPCGQPQPSVRESSRSSYNESEWSAYSVEEAAGAENGSAHGPRDMLGLVVAQPLAVLALAVTTTICLLLLLVFHRAQSVLVFFTGSTIFGGVLWHYCGQVMLGQSGATSKGKTLTDS